MIRLVVGLGNPGAKYADNRHNIGFMVLDRLGAELGEGHVVVAGHQGLFAKVRLEGRDVVLLEPATYMNRSGDAVVSAMDALDIANDEILVVHDELDVPFGGLKLKRGGGAAGHNGLRSIIGRCGGPGFARLRVGIGRPAPGAASITDWVLGDFSQSDGARLDRVLDDATRALRAAVADGIDVAMRSVNARRPDPNEDLKTDLPRSGRTPGPKDRGENMSAAKKLAREYELIYILRPNLGAAEAKKVSDRITSVLETRNGTLTRVDQWGKRKLAYPIQKHTRGVFVYLRIMGFSDVIAEIERNLRILEGVIRYQTVRLEGLFDLDALEVDPEEIEFRELEGGEEDENEPSYEEQLGMRRPEPPRSVSDQEGEGSEAAAKGDAESGDEAEKGAGAGPAGAEPAEAEKAEAEPAEAEKAEPAEPAEAEKAEPAEAEPAEGAQEPAAASSDETEED